MSEIVLCIHLSHTNLRPCYPHAVRGDHLVTPDGHAEVHCRWLQGGAAGGEEAFLLPG